MRESTIPIPQNTLFVSSRGVSIFNGPIVSEVSPNVLTIGSTGSITINGSNLSGVTAVYFLTSAGTLDDLIVTSNFSVNEDGTSMTATIAVGGSASAGNRFLVVRTNRGNSLVLIPNANRVTIQ